MIFEDGLIAWVICVSGQVNEISQWAVLLDHLFLFIAFKGVANIAGYFRAIEEPNSYNERDQYNRADDEHECGFA